MNTSCARKMIKGISVLNPVDVDRDYYLFTVDYAIKNGYDHIQLIGPTHDGVKGNVDGMIFNKKYSQFNGTKDSDYVNLCLSAVNQALEKSHSAGIKTYFWHHELDLPNGFNQAFPQVLNDYGDVEVTHPIVKDYLENRILDFFEAYPKMDGLILTLHETKVPLLKLKNQKLDKIGRVKYVTKILFDTCKRLNKELIVRPFASIEEDYVMMTKAYEEISNDMVIMDKWTQFDWSLTAPHNKFYSKIKNNPLFVETDIFGEFFGKGRLPLMLKEHIKEKFEYCEKFNPVGYVSRIDRNGQHPFGEVNEVNLNIMHAVMNGLDVEKVIDDFMSEKYGEYGYVVKEAMNQTEEVLKKIIYLKGYYYSELSLFPTLNHSKNHFYFEMMKEDFCIASNEWFIPVGWERGSLESVINEKRQAKDLAVKLKELILSLKGKIDDGEFEKLFVKFTNLDLVARCWFYLTESFVCYARYFESGIKEYQDKLLDALNNLKQLNNEGTNLLGDKFYCLQQDSFSLENRHAQLIDNFVKETLLSFEYEKVITEQLKAQNLTDFIVCGGGNEGHKLQKEVNFSDTLFVDGELVRIPGNRKGMKWSTINAHGWFSYQLKVKPNCENKIIITATTNSESLDMKVSIGGTEKIIEENVCGKKDIVINYFADSKDQVRIRIDRISANTPCIYTIKVN